MEIAINASGSYYPPSDWKIALHFVRNSLPFRISSEGTAAKWRQIPSGYGNHDETR